MLVRSPLLTSHKWRELVSCGHLVCRCHGVFSLALRWFCFASFFSFFLFFLFFRPYAFVEAAALRSIVLRYAGVPIATCVSFFYFFLFLFIWRCRFFRVFFFVPFPLSLCMESTSYVLPSGWCFFYLVTTGWIFYIGLCESLINQSIKPLYAFSVQHGVKKIC